MRYCILFLLSLFYLNSFGLQSQIIDGGIKIDSTVVSEMNKRAYKSRLTNPDQTISIAKKAQEYATRIDFKKGIAEANRVIGIGFSYQNQRDSAINHYLLSINLFQKLKDQIGEAKVANNIGNLWTEIDYDRALQYYQKTLSIAEKFNIKDLIAGSYLNIGNVFYRKKNYTLALKNYEKSNLLFEKINNAIGITQSLQNMGVIFLSLGETERAEILLLKANKKAKENELNNSIASINMNLSAIYIQKIDYKSAEKYIEEGIAFAKLVNDDKKMYDYTYISYELENSRKDYKKALVFLKKVNVLDSVKYRENIASNINLIQQTLKQQQTQKENELTIQAQKNAQKLSIATGIVAVLAFFVIFLLVLSNKRSKSSNQKLTALNEEVIKQKNNVDRINHQLEELIAERTKDLIIKNQKLSEYSSHLSHQIRGPVATLKGLMILIEDKLVTSNEVAPQIKKCVDDIDEKIMGINEDLHNASKKGLG